MRVPAQGHGAACASGANLPERLDGQAHSVVGGKGKGLQRQWAWASAVGGKRPGQLSGPGGHALLWDTAVTCEGDRTKSREDSECRGASRCPDQRQDVLERHAEAHDSGDGRTGTVETG